MQVEGRDSAMRTFCEAHSQNVRSGWLRVVMRRRLAAASAELREDEADTDAASLWRVAMPPLRRGAISSSELSSSYRFFFILVRFLHKRTEVLSVCQRNPRINAFNLL